MPSSPVQRPGWAAPGQCHDHASTDGWLWSRTHARAASTATSRDTVSANLTLNSEPSSAVKVRSARPADAAFGSRASCSRCSRIRATARAPEHQSSNSPQLTFPSVRDARTKHRSSDGTSRAARASSPDEAVAVVRRGGLNLTVSSSQILIAASCPTTPPFSGLVPSVSEDQVRCNGGFGSAPRWSASVSAFQKKLSHLHAGHLSAARHAVHSAFDDFVAVAQVERFGIERRIHVKLRQASSDRHPLEFAQDGRPDARPAKVGTYVHRPKLVRRGHNGSETDDLAILVRHQTQFVGPGDCAPDLCASSLVGRWRPVFNYFPRVVRSGCLSDSLKEHSRHAQRIAFDGRPNADRNAFAARQVTLRQAAERP